VTDSYPPVINGVSYVVEHLAREMARVGHTVEVATINDKMALSEVARVNGVIVKRFLGFRPAGSYHIPTPGIFRALGERHDIVHVHNFHSVMPLVSSSKLITKQRDTRWVVTPHFHVPGHHPHSRIAWLMYKPMLAKSIPRFDFIHCVSRWESNQVFQHFGVKSIVIGNGVDEDVYSHTWTGPPEGDIEITFVGRLDEYKRADLVLEAAKLLSSKGHSTRINIVGTGPKRGDLQRLAREYGLSLNLVRRLPREQLLNLVARSSCVVNPSQFEAYSLAVAEALAMGVPAVITYPWGINFSEYPRALLVEPDPASIANGILKAHFAGSAPYRRVPVWSQVVQEMCNRIYSAGQG